MQRRLWSSDRAGPVFVLLAAEALLLACTLAGTSGAATPTPASRVDFRDLLDPAFNAVAVDPDGFGGAFLNMAHSQLTVLYLGDEAAARAKVEPWLPTGLPVQWIRVNHSARELSRIRGEIIEYWKAIGMDRISVVSVDEPNNRVEVGIPEPDAEVSIELSRRYGDAVWIVIAPPDQPA